MAVREIVLSTDSFIRKKSKQVKEFDEKLWELLDDMKETMNESNGVGIAAVQVGVLKRVFIISINGMTIEFINPQILEKDGTQRKVEGCLSVKMPHGVVERAEKIKIKAFDRYENEFVLEVHDWVAVCIQHEYDHLDGILYIDKVIEEVSEENK